MKDVNVQEGLFQITKAHLLSSMAVGCCWLLVQDACLCLRSQDEMLKDLDGMTSDRETALKVLRDYAGLRLD
jgi:hypothetical protein